MDFRQVSAQISGDKNSEKIEFHGDSRGSFFTFGSIPVIGVWKTGILSEIEGKFNHRRSLRESIIWNIEKQKSSTLDNLMVGDLRYCIVLLFIMCTLSGDLNKLKISLTFTFSKILIVGKMGYIDVGDGCWRRNVLVTTFGCWCLI